MRHVTLKADLHLHTSEGEAFIAYDARSLIDRAARAGFQVVSITNHDVVTFDRDLAAYARDQGILRACRSWERQTVTLSVSSGRPGPSSRPSRR